MLSTSQHRDLHGSMELSATILPNIASLVECADRRNGNSLTRILYAIGSAEDFRWRVGDRLNNMSLISADPDGKLSCKI